MLHPLVIGLGRSGSGLHLRALAKARAAAGDLFTTGPVMACDPDPGARRGATGVHAVGSLSAAVEQLDPANTVAHVCTPPGERVPVLTELAVRGIRRAIVEKPLATDLDELATVRQLIDQHGMDIAVVAHWLDSALTERLAALLSSGRLGALRRIGVAQHKPRFTRTAGDGQHPTAFDVEIPHSLGLVQRLAGPADLLDAEWTDMHCGDTVLPRIGSARLALQHHTGVRTEIDSDLTSPVQERRITLEFTRGSATGHFPISDRDDHAQLVIGDQREIFRDDALTEFAVRTYRHFHHGCGPGRDLDLHCRAVRLVADAKKHCASSGSAPRPPISERITAERALKTAPSERTADHAR